MFEVLLAWIGLGLYVACAFGAIAAGVRIDKHATPESARKTSRA